MIRINRLLIIAVPALILGAVGFRLARDLERYEYTDTKGYSRRAREDSFLALRRWTGMNGIILEEKRTDDLTNYDSILINCSLLNDSIFAMELRFWVMNGGHLTLFATQYGQSEKNLETVNEFLSEFGLSTSVQFHPEAQWGMENETRLRGTEKDEWLVTVSPILRIIPEELPPDAFFVPYGDIEDDDADDMDDADNGAEIGFRLLSFPAESGRLTITGDPLFLRNEYIGESDNALLAWELITADSGNNRILFLPDAKKAAPFADNPWAVAVPAALFSALILAAWTALVRRDALLDERPPAGSDIRRRLKAEGNFYRTYGCTETYLTACRKNALRRLRRRGFADSEGRIDTEALSRKLHRDPAALERAFTANPNSESRRDSIRLFSKPKRRGAFNRENDGRDTTRLFSGRRRTNRNADSGTADQRPSNLDIPARGFPGRLLKGRRHTPARSKKQFIEMMQIFRDIKEVI